MEGEKGWTWRWRSWSTKRSTHLNTVAGIDTYKSILPRLNAKLHQACPKCSGVILHLEWNKIDSPSHTHWEAQITIRIYGMRKKKPPVHGPFHT